MGPKHAPLPPDPPGAARRSGEAVPGASPGAPQGRGSPCLHPSRFLEAAADRTISRGRDTDYLEGERTIEIIDVDYRIDWDGNDQYQAVFQVTARTADGSEETIGYTADPVFEDDDEATHFAEGFKAELLGA